MTPEMEHIGKILVEAEGGCWHKWEIVLGSRFYHCYRCNSGSSTKMPNPDFSKWENFGRLLKIARRGIDDAKPLMSSPKWIEIMLKAWSYGNLDQIPALVATELAKILESK